MGQPQSIVASLGSFWRRGQRIERVGYIVGALLLVSGLIHFAILVIGGGSWQGPVSLRKPTTFGLSFGLTLITVVWVSSFGFAALMGAVIAGALMIAKGMRLVFAGDPQTAYATGGTLKPTHAVTMHAILVLPLLAWLLSFTNWSERRRTAAVLVASAGYTLLAVVVTAENVAGVELRQMSPPMLALVVVGVVLSLGTAALAVFAQLKQA